MVECIDKNELREYISGYIKLCKGKPIYTDIDVLVGIIELLDTMPAADVQRMNRGHWEENHATYIKQLDAWFVQAKCSCCGRYNDKMDNYSQYLDLEYCSHCGADMRETNNEVV